MAADPSPDTADIAYRDLPGLQQDLEAGRLTAAQVTEALLLRIEDLDHPDSPTALRAVLAVSEQALDEAKASDDRRRRLAGGPTLPLEGIPVVVKDTVEVKGLPSCAGSTALATRPATGDAELVSRLRAAGAVIVGTTNLTEWSNIRDTRSTGGWSAVGGLTANPWALDRNAGGSSSGSGAAVAAGLAPLAVGSETDGSITCPCSLNGVAGIKPAVGTVPTTGTVPISFSQDSPGPMARTAAGVRALLEILAGRTWPARPLPTITVGAATTWRTHHPATDELFDETLERLRAAGAKVVEVGPPAPDSEAGLDEFTVLLCELKDSMDRYLPTRGPDGPQTLAEVIAFDDAHPDTEMPWFGHDLFERAVATGGTDTDGYRQARARNLAWALQTCLQPTMEGIDVLVAPTYGPAWKTDLVLGGHPAVAAPTTMAPAIAGWPIATVPMGLASGLPVGLGIVGRPGSEGDLLSVGTAVERPLRPTWEPPGRG